jgi:hypothetical protein
VWADFWASSEFQQQYNSNTDWAALFDPILEFSETLLVLGDVPTIQGLCPATGPCGGSMLKNYVYTRGMSEGNFAFLTRVVEHPASRSTRLMLEAAMQAAALLPRLAGRVKFVKMDSYFQTNTEPPFLQLVDPISGGLVYYDPHHLNEDGARRAEQVFRKELFGQPTC